MSTTVTGSQIQPSVPPSAGVFHGGILTSKTVLPPVFGFLSSFLLQLEGENGGTARQIAVFGPNHLVKQDSRSGQGCRGQTSSTPEKERRGQTSPTLRAEIPHLKDIKKNCRANKVRQFLLSVHDDRPDSKQVRNTSFTSRYK